MAQVVQERQVLERRRDLVRKLLRNGLVRTSIMRMRQTDGPKEGVAEVKPLA
jgi:hypothetical protein